MATEQIREIRKLLKSTEMQIFMGAIELATDRDWETASHNLG